MTDCIALIVAAGRGIRFGGAHPKQYQLLGGHPLLTHTLSAFIAHPRVHGVRVVIHPDDRPFYDAATEGLSLLLEPVSGGASRQESVLLGLESLTEIAPSHVLIHDGARPFPDARLISRVIDALADAEGAIPALAVSDTLKQAAHGEITGTVSRDGLWRAQTPQGFRYHDILAAHRAAIGKELTDDAAVAEAAGLAVRLVEGSEDNVKITESADILRAERRFEPLGGSFRIGQGFDVHRFRPGSRIRLCGIDIPFDQELDGHSDADVGLHAIVDAILGALALGDIGQYFPPSDPRWKGCDSGHFLAHAGQLAAEAGARILNIDVTLICEAPKIGPHRQTMRERIADILGLSVDQVSVKATTTEGLGFTGRREGIAAQAVANLGFAHPGLRIGR